jgi:hypothetical protein
MEQPEKPNNEGCACMACLIVGAILVIVSIYIIFLP